MADKELHSHMVALGHPGVGFAHGTAASLYNGSILWHGGDRPNNFSFLTLYENNLFSETQTSHFLSLIILTLNINKKNIDKIKASQKQTVTVPKDYPELINVIEMYHSMSSILLGEATPSR